MGTKYTEMLVFCTESCPKATGARPCTEATEAELRIKDLSEAAWALL